MAKQTWELGYTGLIGDKVRFDVSAYTDRYRNFIGPLKTLTPNVFLDGNSVATYLVTRLAAVGVPAVSSTTACCRSRTDAGPSAARDDRTRSAF